jgi:Dyp-type peroxidase family
MAQASVTDAPHDTSAAPALVESQGANLKGKRAVPDHAQVQGLVYSALSGLTKGRYDLLRITDPAACRAWLGGLAPALVTADQAISLTKGGTPDDADRGLFVAFTASGLRRLGLPDAVLQTFSTPFAEGVVTPHRSRILGDHHANAPERWEWGGPGNEVDLLVISLWQDDAVRTELDAQLGIGAVGSVNDAAGTTVVHSQRTDRLGDASENLEHFGFVDGISNLRFRGELGADTAADGRYSVVGAGEVVLGCVDDSGLLPRSPVLGDAAAPIPGPAEQARDLGLDGSYLVLRDLRQDVAAFRRWLAEHGADRAAQDDLAARIIGRRYDGTPLVPLDSSTTDDNAFGFIDHDGTAGACPIGAHIRRANPRDGRRGSDGETDGGGPDSNLAKTKRHRILRRGRSYGPPLADGDRDDGADRGLLFVALNADIERQFEFVQSHWLGSETFARPGEVDPLIGVVDDGERHFTVEARPGESLRTRYGGLPQFVTVTGGAYFFLPRVAVVTYLSTLA